MEAPSNGRLAAVLMLGAVAVAVALSPPDPFTLAGYTAVGVGVALLSTVVVAAVRHGSA